uniref:type IV toxin-antitoxin system AbiEi family antitoxin domain-containing protein n=1 Tax=Telmatospirillum sp. J64-1 TaxID=2502183 RepID=UPI001C8F301C
MSIDFETRQRIFDAVGQGGCLTIDEMTEATALPRRRVSEVLSRLIERGIMERVERGCFRLSDDGKQAQDRGIPLKKWRCPNTPTRAKAATLKVRLWRAMRLQGIGGRFTIGDLLALAARDEKKAASHASIYLNRLAEAGYLRRLPKRQPSDVPGSQGYVRYQ